MEFEKALRSELKSITGLSNKVFPLNAPEGTDAPYVTYESGDYHKEKALSGFLSYGSLECTVDVFGATYAQMKSISALVIAKIESFIQCSIGTTGPHIQNVTFDDLLPETYEPEIDKYRKSIGFTVNY